MKQKLKRFMAGFLAVLTMFTTLFANGMTTFAASPSAKIQFWHASARNVGERYLCFISQLLNLDNSIYPLRI